MAWLVHHDRSMLGNSSFGNSSPLGTSVGIRGLTTVTPTTAKKIAKKKGVDGEAKVDKVDRDDPRANRMLQELADGLEEAVEEGMAQPPGHSTAVRWVEGDAFRTDTKGRLIAPAFSDVDQGNLGDAWLLAACAAVAHVAPSYLTRRIMQNEDKSFTVRLGEEHMRITPEFPGEGYADPLPNGQRDTLWVALLEKAYAQHEGGSYANLEVGSAGRAMEMLTGQPSRRESLSELTSLDRLWRILSESKQSSRPMVVRTREMNVAAPLAGEHHYAVLDVSERGGGRFVKLYNPWGTKQNSRPIENMVYEISLDTLRNDCEALYVSQS